MSDVKWYGDGAGSLCSLIQTFCPHWNSVSITRSGTCFRDHQQVSG